MDKAPLAQHTHIPSTPHNPPHISPSDIDNAPAHAPMSAGVPASYMQSEHPSALVGTAHVPSSAMACASVLSTHNCGKPLGGFVHHEHTRTGGPLPPNRLFGVQPQWHAVEFSETQFVR